MFRVSKLLVTSFAALLTIAVSQATVSAQHFCPDCGRQVTHPITVHGESASVEGEVIQTVGEQVISQPLVIEQPVNAVQQVSFEQPVIEQPVYAQPASFEQPFAQVQQTRVGDSYQAMAQRSANYRASRGIKGHGFTSGQREGVGWSSRSAADAIRQCCYSNSTIPRRVAVVRGRDGWYATTIYVR